LRIDTAIKGFAFVTHVPEDLPLKLVEVLIGNPSAGKPGVHLITDSQCGESGWTVGIKNHQI